MTLEQLLWLLCGLGVPIALVVLLIFFPHRLIKLQGEFYRYYYGSVRHLSDEEVDNIYQLPSDRLLMGNRSDFIRMAETDPKQFRTLTIIYRTIGIVIGALLLLTIGLLLLGFATNSFA